MALVVTVLVAGGDVAGRHGGRGDVVDGVSVGAAEDPDHHFAGLGGAQRPAVGGGLARAGHAVQDVVAGAFEALESPVAMEGEAAVVVGQAGVGAVGVDHGDDDVATLDGEAGGDSDRRRSRRGDDGVAHLGEVLVVGEVVGRDVGAGPSRARDLDLVGAGRFRRAGGGDPRVGVDDEAGRGAAAEGHRGGPAEGAARDDDLLAAADPPRGRAEAGDRRPGGRWRCHGEADVAHVVGREAPDAGVGAVEDGQPVAARHGQVGGPAQAVVGEQRLGGASACVVVGVGAVHHPELELAGEHRAADAPGQIGG